jgi:hypothetical protein
MAKQSPASKRSLEALSERGPRTPTPIPIIGKREAPARNRAKRVSSNSPETTPFTSEEPRRSRPNTVITNCAKTTCSTSRCSSHRTGERPQDFAAAAAYPKERADDPFLLGNEHLSAPEIGRIGSENAWQIRWFENKYPFFNPNGKRESPKYNPLLQSEPAVGFHEIIVATPVKNRQFWDFTPKQIEALLRVYQSEIDRLQDKGYKFVQIFKNHGPSAGTSIVHEHTQVVGLPFVPRVSKRRSQQQRATSARADDASTAT